MTDLSIIIPCYNEADGIPQLREQLLHVQELFKKESRALEFILVDDCSRDNTAELLEPLAQELDTAHLIRHSKNGGLGQALRTGVAACKSPWIAAVDSDCTYRPFHLLPMLEMAEQQGADIVVGSCYHPEGGLKGVPHWAKLISRSCSILYQIVLPSRLYTFTAIFRLYRAEVVKAAHFPSDGFLAVSEMLVDPLLAGAHVVEYPIVLHNRVYGDSKRKIARMIRAHLGYLGKIVAHKLRLKRNPRWR